MPEEESESMWNDLERGNKEFVRAYASKEQREPKYTDVSSVFACVDSRVAPGFIFAGMEPGESYVNRSIGSNIGTFNLASAELVVRDRQITNVKRIIWIGHNSCGGIKGGMRHLSGEAQISDKTALDRLLFNIGSGISLNLKDFQLGGQITEHAASLANMSAQIEKLTGSRIIRAAMEDGNFPIYATEYDVETGMISHPLVFRDPKDHRGRFCYDQKRDAEMLSLLEKNRQFADSVDRTKLSKLAMGQHPQALMLSPSTKDFTPAMIFNRKGVDVGDVLMARSPATCVGEDMVATTEFAIGMGVKEIFYLSYAQDRTIDRALAFGKEIDYQDIQGTALHELFSSICSNVSKECLDMPITPESVKRAANENALGQIETLFKSSSKLREAREEKGMPIHHISYDRISGLVSPIATYSSERDFSRRRTEAPLYETPQGLHLREGERSRQRTSKETS